MDSRRIEGDRLLIYRLRVRVPPGSAQIFSFFLGAVFSVLLSILPFYRINLYFFAPLLSETVLLLPTPRFAVSVQQS